jgi:hypothetical protein
MLPLILPAWVVGVVVQARLPTTLATLYGLITAAIIINLFNKYEKRPEIKNLLVITSGSLLVVFAAFLFGNSWTVVIAEHEFAIQQSSFLNSSLCQDWIGFCIISDDTHYQSQLVPAILSEMLLYLGVAVIIKGLSLENIKIEI